MFIFMPYFYRHRILCCCFFNVLYVAFTQSDPSSPVLVAGDPERKQMAANDKQGGIKYHENQIAASVRIILNF
jgi:hypothetical protein